MQFTILINTISKLSIVSGEGLAPIVSAYSRLILVDGTVFYITIMNEILFCFCFHLFFYNQPWTTIFS
jgi:hypothetical protein